MRLSDVSKICEIAMNAFLSGILSYWDWSRRAGWVLELGERKAIIDSFRETHVNNFI